MHPAGAEDLQFAALKDEKVSCPGIGFEVVALFKVYQLSDLIDDAVDGGFGVVTLCSQQSWDAFWAEKLKAPFA